MMSHEEVPTEKRSPDKTPTQEAPTPPAEDTATTADTEATDSPDEMTTLRAQLEEARAEVATLREQMLREQAEVENFKKRMRREKADAIQFAREPFMRDLLPVVDNLERAIAHGDSDSGTVIEGVQLVLKSLLEVLSRNGVSRVESLEGQPFDPAQHEAISQAESAEHDPNCVIAQHSVGYLLHERLLRPAMVTVNSRKNTPSVAETPDSD